MSASDHSAPGENKRRLDDGRIVPVRAAPLTAVQNLVRHVAYAEYWMRHTEAFDNALTEMGWRREPRGLLFDETGALIDDPQWDEA